MGTSSPSSIQVQALAPGSTGAGSSAAARIDTAAAAAAAPSGLLLHSPSICQTPAHPRLTRESPSLSPDENSYNFVLHPAGGLSVVPRRSSYRPCRTQFLAAQDNDSPQFYTSVRIARMDDTG